jgi:hypothetical protein
LKRLVGLLVFTTGLRTSSSSSPSDKIVISFVLDVESTIEVEITLIWGLNGRTFLNTLKFFPLLDALGVATGAGVHTLIAVGGRTSITTVF